MVRSYVSIAAFCITGVLAGCSGSGDSGPTTAPLSVQVVDAPIDPEMIDRVCISFTAITVHYAGNEDVRIDYDPLPSQVSAETHCTDGWNGLTPVPPVRLDALSGSLTVALVDSLRVPIGRIQWIRLHFDDGSYLVDSMGEHPLECPSCEITDNNQGRGFKLNRSFEVPAGGLALLVDIDLLKSLHQTVNGYILRPTARVEPDDTLGTIAGNVHPQLIDDLGGTPYTGGDVDTGCAVYVFAADAEIDDFHYTGSTVISTATVRYNGEPEPDDYSYAAGALAGGEAGMPESYQVVLTCDQDDPLDDDDGTVVTFTDPPLIVDLLAGETAEANFSP
jgi:hypothetical protein